MSHELLILRTLERSRNAGVPRGEKHGDASSTELCEAKAHSLGPGFGNGEFVFAVGHGDDLRDVFLAEGVVQPG